MHEPACAIGRLASGGPWIGFAPSLDDGYRLIVEGAAASVDATPYDLLALAILYFEDGMEEPPEALAATHGDIGALIRHLADSPRTPIDLRAALVEVVDAVDDGLAADVVISRLEAALGGDTDARELLARRARTVLGA